MPQLWTRSQKLEITAVISLSCTSVMILPLCFAKDLDFWILRSITVLDISVFVFQNQFLRMAQTLFLRDLMMNMSELVRMLPLF